MGCSPVAPVSTKFSEQEDWSGLPFPILGDLPDSGNEPASPAAPASTGGFLTTSATRETHIFHLSANSTVNDRSRLPASVTI